MLEKKRITLLIVIMASSCLIVAGVTMAMLYNTSFDQQKARLSEIAQSQARLIEAIARFNAANYHGDTLEAVMKQLSDAHSHYKGFGDTGEFTLGKREGDQIVFLLSHRHYDLDKPKPIPMNSHLGAPIRAAVSGRSGTLIGPDYRGEIVLAAHEPVAELNLGIAAKIDLAEIRKPFIRTGCFTGIIMLLVVLFGTLLFIRISDPILREIENNRKWLNTTLRSIGDGVIATDDKGVVVFMNPAAEYLTGYKEEQAVGKFLGKIFNIVNEKTRKPVENPVVKVLREGIIVGLANHTILISKDGIEHAIDDSGAPIRDDKNNIIGVVMVFRDVSAARKAENNLKESEMRFAAFMENLPACAFIKDSQGHLLFINDYLKQLFGFEDWVNKTTVELIQSDVAIQMTEDDRRAMTTGAIIVQESIRDVQGNQRVFETVKFPIRTLNGKIFLGGIAIDITERKKTEKALTESETRYRELFDNINSGVAVYDVIDNGKDFIFKDFNKAGERSDNEKREELIGRSIFEARPGVEKFGLIEVFRKVWETGEPIHHPITLYDDERLKGWYENFVYKLPSGEIVAVFEDRTVQKQAEYMLRKYNEKLESEVRRRTDELKQQQVQLAHAGRLSSLGEMATGIAHELSQPLFIIRLSAETLQLMLRKSGTLTRKYSEEISSIIASVERASAIINHVRGFARTQHSCLEDICLKEAVENSLIFFTQQFRHREITLIKHYEGNLPQVKADIQRFEQVVVNLLSNARYAVDKRKEQESEDYQKKIEIRLLHDITKNAVVLEVSDNGIGMSADEKERCLDPFFTTKDVGEGTGLGLSISHGIIREFKGHIGIESEKGVGTTVRVSIPVA